MENNNYVPEIYIGENGNWFINGVDTGTHAQGENGEDGVTPHISKDGYWCIGETCSWVKAFGEQGAKGDKGDTGEKGSQGPKGDKGDTGSQGASGTKGEQGVQGEQGMQGVMGSRGLTGPQGPQGATGAQGPTGATGPQGLTGPKGDTGAQGPKGDMGLTGPQGKQGIAGPEGVKGDRGETGPVNIANNLTTTGAGFALDAIQGKVLDDKITAVNRNLEFPKTYVWKGEIATNTNMYRFPARIICRQYSNHTCDIHISTKCEYSNPSSHTYNIFSYQSLLSACRANSISFDIHQARAIQLISDDSGNKSDSLFWGRTGLMFYITRDVGYLARVYDNAMNVGGWGTEVPDLYAEGNHFEIDIWGATFS